MPSGSFGKLGLGNGPVGSDFLAPDNDYTWPSGTGHIDGVAFVSVNEGTIEWTVDEPGGVVAFTTDTADNDNVAMCIGTFRPTDGGCWMECRFKVNHLTTAVFFGFTETLALDTPVMPAEFATVTMTYNGSGGMIGANYDFDGTTDDFRAVMADGGTNTGDSDANGTRFTDTPTADEWYIGRVEIDRDGTGRVLLGHDSGNAAASMKIKEFNTAGVNPNDLFYAVLFFENRSGDARILEVDYFYACGGRDWSV
jgi:hypothetical protein